jgi:alpha-galactosidase
MRSVDGDLDVWARPLQGGSWAVGLSNQSEQPADITVSWSDLGVPPETKAMVRDLWIKADLGIHTDHYTRTVAPHDCAVVRISPALGAPPPQPSPATR